MTSNSESVDQTSSSVDSSCFPSSKCKTSLRLRLGRVFSTGGLSPKSPKSVSSSRGSSPNSGSPHAKTRYSWQPGTFTSEENRSPRTSESGISTLSSSSSSKSPPIDHQLTTNVPKSPSSPTKNMYFSTWYTDGRWVTRKKKILQSNLSSLARDSLAMKRKIHFSYAQRRRDIEIYFRSTVTNDHFNWGKSVFIQR